MPNDPYDPVEQMIRRQAASGKRGKRKVDYMGILEGIGSSIVSGAKAVKNYFEEDTTNNPYYGPVDMGGPKYNDEDFLIKGTGPRGYKPKKKKD